MKHRRRPLFPLLALLFIVASLPLWAWADFQDEYLPGEVLVGVRSDQARLASAIRIAASVGRVVQQLPAIQTYRVQLRSSLSVPDAIARPRQRADVLYAEPNLIGHVCATPDDPFYARQTAPQLIQADRAWDIWQPHQQVVIAIVDSGIAIHHPDLTNVLYRDATGALIGYNALTRNNDLQDDLLFGHGTWCAGIAAAQINNGIGVAGIAGWNPAVPASETYVKLMPVKVIDSTDNAPVATLADGIIWAADHGARVISMSLSINHSVTLSKALEYAWDRNCVLVAAAGNHGSSDRGYPAGQPQVLAVAATDHTDKLTAFSNYGSWVRVATLGRDVLGTAWPSGYHNGSGTSASAPEVAGEAALLLAQNPQLTNGEVNQLIVSHVDPYWPYFGRRLAVGAGRVNVFRAVQAAGVGIATLTSITLRPARVRGGEQTTGAVFLGGHAPSGGLVVTLSNSDPSLASMPASVTVPEGAAAATFPVTTTGVSSAHVLAIRASFVDVIKTTSLAVLPLGLSRLEMRPATVTGGAPTTGFVDLSGPAPAGGVVVRLESQNRIVAVPVTVTIPGGATSASFAVTTHPVRRDREVGLAAAYQGETEEALLIVKPPVLRTLILSASRAVGGIPVTGAVTLTGPAPGRTAVLLASDNAAASAPASVIVPDGETGVAFEITTRPVTAQTLVRITARRRSETQVRTLLLIP